MIKKDQKILKYKEMINPLVEEIVDMYLHTEDYLDDEQRISILKRMRGRFMQEFLEHAVGEFKK